jgi:hypothetical protein|tara:strand:- start:889 stop:1452 length:564 start_codon:yes stop_codon:yes gene_type:complete
MGFDIYGLNPRQHNEKPEILNKNFMDITDKDEQDEYFEANANYEKETPGTYFRNNVWWWRPLWEYIIEISGDLLTPEQRQGGYENSCTQIPENITRAIARRLSYEISSGNHKRYETEYREAIKNLELEDCEHCNTTGEREWEDGPAQCNACSGEGKRESWEASYPFDVGNVEEFRIFLEQSGGMEIC